VPGQLRFRGQDWLRTDDQFFRSVFF
jgi:hypothetical protein